MMINRESEVRRIEKQLCKSLDNILNDIKSSGTKDISLLQRHYGQRVQHALRAAIQKVYVIAGENVMAKRNKHPTEKPLTKFVMDRLKAAGHITEQDEQRLLRGAALAAPLNEHFLTQADLSAIVNKVREYSDIFWRRIAATLRQDDILSGSRGSNPSSILNARLNDNA